MANEKQKEVYQVTQETWETINVLYSGITHFGNLLMEIHSNTSLMRQETDSASSNYQQLLNIERQVATGSRLSERIHCYVRARPHDIRPVDLNQLLREFSDVFAPAWKQIRVHQELAVDLYPIVADKRLIIQVLMDLCLNAAEAMSGKGDLFLKTMNVTHEALKDLPETAKPGDYVLLTIADTGVGMDMETIERVFDPFFTTKEMDEGAGLGLTIVRAIIKNHGGSITVSSKEGVGTSFNIYLPAARERKEAY